MAGLLDTALDMSLAARRARARAMGFDPDVTWYHGTYGDVPRFEGGTLNASTLQAAPFHHFGTARAANERLEELYGMKMPKGNERFMAMQPVGEVAKGASIIPVNLKNADSWPLVSDEASNSLSQLTRELVRQQVVSTSEIDAYDGDVIAALKDKGIGGVRYVNNNEAVGSVSVAVFDPKDIRSIHAAFDPAKASSSDLLAGIAPWAAAGGLGLLAASMPGESRAAKLSREMEHREPSRPVDRLERLQAGMQMGAAANVPIASDLMGLLGDALMYYRDPSSRTWGNYLGTGVGLLPFVP